MDKVYDIVLTLCRASSTLLCIVSAATLIPMAVDEWKWLFERK